MLVHVLDHHDSAINHCPDGNSDTAQGHDIGVQPLQVHNDKGGENTDGQTDDGHQAGADMEQKYHTHQGNDDELLQQLMPQVFNGAFNQSGTVVNRHDFHTFGKTRLKGFQFGFHTVNGFLGVFAKAHHHDATDGFTFAIQLGNTPAHLRTYIDIRHIFQQQWCALDVDT